MTGFQKEKAISFAWITYPLRANTNYGLLLVNGQPPIVNVEDLKLLDKKDDGAESSVSGLEESVSAG